MVTSSKHHYIEWRCTAVGYPCTCLFVCCSQVSSSCSGAKHRTKKNNATQYPMNCSFLLPKIFSEIRLGLFLSYMAFVFSFSFFFVSVPCARLGWPSRQFLSARKYTTSYHIVSYRTPNEGAKYRWSWLKSTIVDELSRYISEITR